MARSNPLGRSATRSARGLVRNTGAAARGGLESPAAIAARLRVAAALVSLDDLTIEAVTVAGRTQLGLPVAEVVGRPILDVVAPAERDHARAAFEALQSGAIDFYRAERAPLVSGAPGSVWARKLELDGRSIVLAAWFGLGSDRDRPIRAVAGRLLGQTLAVGIADRDGVVRSVSVDETDAPGVASESLLGRHLYGPSQDREMATIRRGSGQSRTGASVAYPLDWPELGGASRQLVCVLAALAGTDDRLFLILSVPTGPGAREAELEGHLWRIAAEVEASGILLRVGRAQLRSLGDYREAGRLTPRQWDVLRRLVNGERVPTIAGDLFLSPSTVRGHLSAIFDRFGVHSQAELLSLLASDDGMRTSGSSG